MFLWCCFFVFCIVDFTLADSKTSLNAFSWEKKKKHDKKTKDEREKLEAPSPRGAGREAAPARPDGGREHEMWRGIF